MTTHERWGRCEEQRQQAVEAYQTQTVKVQKLLQLIAKLKDGQMRLDQVEVDLTKMTIETFPEREAPAFAKSKPKPKR